MVDILLAAHLHLVLMGRKIDSSVPVTPGNECVALEITGVTDDLQAENDRLNASNNKNGGKNLLPKHKHSCRLVDIASFTIFEPLL